MLRRARPSSSDGFTLIEVILVVTIIAVIVTNYFLTWFLYQG